MPATRTRQHRSRQATSPTRDLPGRTTPEVIVISSDDEDTRPGSSSRSTIKKPPMVKKPRHLVDNYKLQQTNELLERQVAHQREEINNSNKRLEEQGQKLVAANLEIAKVRRELQKHQEKIAALEAKGPSIGATKLGDMLSCGICTEMMHSPHMLADCGHSYCEGCLKGWFSDMIRRPVPKYTCPGCRKEVTGKPVVNYQIKDMVSIVGGVLGQPDTGREFSNIGGQQVVPFPR